MLSIAFKLNTRLYIKVKECLPILGPRCVLEKYNY